MASRWTLMTDSPIYFKISLKLCQILTKDPLGLTYANFCSAQYGVTMRCIQNMAVLNERQHDQ